MFDRLRQDFRYSVRTLARTPGFTAVAAATIALGVGAATAVFSIVNSVLLRPLPFSEPERLFLVYQQDTKTKATFHDATPANFLDWQRGNHTFSALAAIRGDSVALAIGDHPERVRAADVNGNFFELLGVHAELGRTFSEADQGQAAARVTVIGDALWRERFGARADVIGRSVRIDNEPYTIVGVLPPGLDYPDEAQLWYAPHWAVPDDPLTPGRDPSSERGHSYFDVIGRLRPEVDESEALADMGALAAGLERQYPDDNRNVGVGMRPLGEDIVGDTRPMLLLLLAAVGVLLLIATVNVSGLLIARAVGRRHEIAVRLALGASSARIAGQLLIESLLLACVGGAAGTLLALGVTGPLVALSPLTTGVLRPVHVDARVLLFALGVSTAAGLLFGLAPARQGVSLDVHDDLQQAGRSGKASTSTRVRTALVATEIALSVVLLVAAGLTVRSLIALGRARTGFDTGGVLTVQLNVAQQRYATPQQRADYWSRVQDELASIPGVADAGAVSRLPLAGGNSSRGITIDGKPEVPQPAADYRTVTPGYFRALGIPILSGRGLADADRDGRPLVTVISDSMARRYWPHADPVGHQVTIGTDPITVVGVVGDVRHRLESAARPTFYVPYRQDPPPTMTFALKTSAGLETLGPAIRAAIWRIDADQAVSAILTMDERLRGSKAARRFTVALFVGFGIAAVVLAAVGLYGVLAFLVAERRREIGVRMALGARPSEVLRAVVGEGLMLAVAGLVPGVAAALAASRVLTSILFGTSPTDGPTFVGTAVVLGAVAIAASAIPAWRASRVDPMEALREN